MAWRHARRLHRFGRTPTLRPLLVLVATRLPRLGGAEPVIAMPFMLSLQINCDHPSSAPDEVAFVRGHVWRVWQCEYTSYFRLTSQTQL